MMAVVMVFEEDMMRLICRYAPQREISFEEKVFYDELKGEYGVLGGL